MTKILQQNQTNYSQNKTLAEKEKYCHSIIISLKIWRPERVLNIKWLSIKGNKIKLHKSAFWTKNNLVHWRKQKFPCQALVLISFNLISPKNLKNFGYTAKFHFYKVWGHLFYAAALTITTAKSGRGKKNQSVSNRAEFDWRRVSFFNAVL